MNIRKNGIVFFDILIKEWYIINLIYVSPFWFKRDTLMCFNRFAKLLRHLLRHVQA